MDTKQGRVQAVLSGSKKPVIPIWMMRQAGRYLPEYRALREKATFEELCNSAELAFEATMMPMKRFDLDAAIVFSDILVIPQAMGIDISFKTGGPVTANPIRTQEDVAKLKPCEPEQQLKPVLDALRALRRELDDTKTLFGFCGAPLTLAAYAVEGKGSNQFQTLRRMMFEHPALFEELMEKLTAAVSKHMLAQLDAGADMVQLFDTWGGLLSDDEYREFVLPHIQQIVTAVHGVGQKVALYINGSSHLLRSMVASQADIISLDWRHQISTSAQEIPEHICIQGNLDPAMLFAPPSSVEQFTEGVLRNAPVGRYIFNLGHGIWPETPIASVERMITTIRKYEDAAGQ